MAQGSEASRAANTMSAGLRTLLVFAYLAASLVHAQTTVTVNLGQTFQTMDGFGCSQAFGRANDIVNLPEPQRTTALDLLFKMRRMSLGPKNSRKPSYVSALKLLWLFLRSGR